jgi:hypothetical protein
MSFHVVKDVVIDFATIKDSQVNQYGLAASGITSGVTIQTQVSKMGDKITVQLPAIVVASAAFSVPLVLTALPTPACPTEIVNFPAVVSVAGVISVGILTVGTNGIIAISPISGSFTSGSAATYLGA